MRRSTVSTAKGGGGGGGGGGGSTVQSPSPISPMSSRRRQSSPDLRQLTVQSEFMNIPKFTIKDKDKNKDKEEKKEKKSKKEKKEKKEKKDKKKDKTEKDKSEKSEKPKLPRLVLFTPKSVSKGNNTAKYRSSILSDDRQVDQLVTIKNTKSLKSAHITSAGPLSPRGTIFYEGMSSKSQPTLTTAGNSKKLERSVSSRVTFDTKKKVKKKEAQTPSPAILRTPDSLSNSRKNSDAETEARNFNPNNPSSPLAHSDTTTLSSSSSNSNTSSENGDSDLANSHSSGVTHKSSLVNSNYNSLEEEDMQKMKKRDGSQIIGEEEQEEEAEQSNTLTHNTKNPNTSTSALNQQTLSSQEDLKKLITEEEHKMNEQITEFEKARNVQPTTTTTTITTTTITTIIIQDHSIKDPKSLK